MMDAETWALVERAQQGDQRAFETLLQQNMGLVHSLTKRFYAADADREDLHQQACLGFVKAVQGYDKRYDTAFSTYAVPKIMGEIRRYLRDDGPVKVSRTIKTRARELRRLESKLETERGRSVTVSELAEAAALSPEEVAMCEQATAQPDSLQRVLCEDGSMLGETLGDEGMEEQVTLSLSLRQARRALPQQEKLVLEMRYGRDLTQQQTARILGVSQAQVSRLEKRAVQRLRQAIIAE